MTVCATNIDDVISANNKWINESIVDLALCAYDAEVCGNFDESNQYFDSIYEFRVKKFLLNNRCGVNLSQINYSKKKILGTFNNSFSNNSFDT